jgi:hypothetical protein
MTRTLQNRRAYTALETAQKTLGYKRKSLFNFALWTRQGFCTVKDMAYATLVL